MFIYPGTNDARARVNAMAENLKKQGMSYEVMPMKNDQTAAISFVQSNEQVVEFNLFFFHTTHDGKTLIGRQFVTRTTPDKKASMLDMADKSKSVWLKQLIGAQFPAFTFPKAPSPTAPTLTDLRAVEEKVDDMRHKGKLIVVDKAYLRKQGSDEAPDAPFSIVLPKAAADQGIFITGKPKVPEIIRVSLATKDKKLMENIRFTSLKVGVKDSSKLRVQKALAMIESQMVPKFFNGYVGGKIVDRYQTKVGPYDAGVLLGQMSGKDDKKYFVKFVAIIQPGKADGLVAVMMLDPSTGDPQKLQQRLNNGYVQQVLHTLRFEK